MLNNINYLSTTQESDQITLIINIFAHILKEIVDQDTNKLEQEYFDKWDGVLLNEEVKDQSNIYHSDNNWIQGPSGFFEENIIYLNGDIKANKQQKWFSNKLKLKKHSEGVFHLVESLEQDNSCFSSFWLSQSANKDEIVYLIDVPKHSDKPLVVFTETLSTGSVFITDYDDDHYCIYLDPRFRNQLEYTNVVQSVTALDYKAQTGDSTKDGGCLLSFTMMGGSGNVSVRLVW